MRYGMQMQLSGRLSGDSAVCGGLWWWSWWVVNSAVRTVRTIYCQLFSVLFLMFLFHAL